MFSDNDTYFYQLHDLLTKLRSDDTLTGDRKNETLDMMNRVIEQDRKSYSYMYEGDMLPEKRKKPSFWERFVGV